MPVFADIHTHIVYGTDDGASSFAMSCAMLDIAKEEGIKHIVSTCHFNPPRFDTFGEAFEERFAAVRAEAEKRGISLYKGNELRFDAGNYPDALDAGTAHPINDGKYVLIECHIGDKVFQMENKLDELWAMGYTPILAHPERCENIIADFNVAYNLVDDGVLMQINAGSLLGEYGFTAKRLSRRLLKKDMVFAVASDCHNITNRAPHLTKAYAFVAKKYGEDYAREIFYENPLKAIENLPL